MKDEKIVELTREQMEKVTGGKKRGGGKGDPNKLNGPFCASCGAELIHANGKYKCMKEGCLMNGVPQEGVYN